MRKIVLNTLVPAMLICLSIFAMAWRDGGDTKKAISVVGVTREYLVHVPASLPKGRLASVVLVFPVELYKAGQVEKREAMNACSNEEAFERIINGIKSSEGRKLLNR